MIYYHGTRVMYIPTQELGYVSSCNEKYIFVKFDSQLNKKPAYEVTSQACHYCDLQIVEEVK